MMGPEPGAGIATRAARGMLWNYASFGLGKGLVLVTTAILARLLVPEEFGLVGFATLAVSYLVIVQDFGLGGALVQRRTNVERAADVAFTLNLLVGMALAGLSFLIAPWVAGYFHEPAVTPLLRLLSVSFVIEALGSIHLVRLQRELAFRQKLIPDVGRSIVKGTVSIGCALAGLGAWSLIIGQLAGVAGAVVLAWIVFPWRPRIRFDGGLVRSLLGFGIPLMGADILYALTVNLDYLVVGRRLGSAALGIYTLAFRIPELVVLSVLVVLNQTIFPAFSAVQDRPDTLRRGFLLSVRYVMMFSVPVSLGMILAADPIVKVVLGSDWLEVIPVLRLLALFVLVSSIMESDGDVYKATGRPDLLAKIGVVRLIVLVPGLLIGVNYGLVGVAVGHVVAIGVSRTLRVLVVSRVMRIPLKEILAQFRPALAAGAALAAAASMVLILSIGASPWVRLTGVTIAGAAAYCGVLLAIEGQSLREAVILLTAKDRPDLSPVPAVESERERNGG